MPVGFLRFNEVANIRQCDLQIGVDHLTIKIPDSKTDQLRKGDDIVITRTGMETCPVAMLEDYLKQGESKLGN